MFNSIHKKGSNCSNYKKSALFPNPLSFNHAYPVSLDFPKKVIQRHLYHHLFYHVLKPGSRYKFAKCSLYR